MFVTLQAPLVLNFNNNALFLANNTYIVVRFFQLPFQFKILMKCFLNKRNKNT
jgi:hypothetical protein